ncbi:cytochrome c-type biogenesis protein CcmH [Porticoccus sp. W117]|uniref:cytochrome c-type biogenesis protein n=1 Tax=Porticoccus sp. W117 TaxID=3054777 RepID=UPI002596C133|nr:cytochrome c-type biogenesis protein [Porticoccus sp. W117]MDM3870249.1 cytochrome c-type biogenesis protein CcmH [Porticoccus sp. W117]
MLRALSRFYLIALLLIAPVSWCADLDTFSSEDIRARYLALIDDLRCPQCQNQNLSDSDSAIAVDLRRTVLRLLEEGKGDKEIIDFLVDRYGDFIIYMPQFKSGTYSLWLLPLLLALVGAVVIVLVVRRQRRVTVPSDLNESEQQQLAELLSNSGTDKQENR